MGTTADKLTYLNQTKGLLKDRLNSLGATITSSTTFRNYLTWLDTFYGEVGDKTDIATNGIVGRTSQETTTGKNLLTLASEYNKTQYNVSGTYNTDGSFTVSGTANQSGNAQVTQNTPLVLDAGTYTFSIDHALSKKIYLHIKLSDSTYQNVAIEAGDTSVTDTLTLAATEYNMRYVVSNTDEVNETIKMQLESGSSATSWEKFTYGPSPNPSYPQPIEVVTGQNDITICGKNLFKVYDSNSTLSKYGVDISRNTDGSIKINGTATSNLYVEVLYDFKIDTSNQSNASLKLEDTKSYIASSSIISGTISNNSDLNITMQIFYPSQNNVNFNLGGNGVINNSNGVYRTYFKLNSGVVCNNLVFGIQVEEGSTVTTYEEYTGTTYPINLGKNLFDSNVETKNAYPSSNVGNVVSYTNSTASICYVNCFYVRNGTTYTISYEKNTPASTSQRGSVIIDENNVILESLQLWNNNNTSITFTPTHSGYLIYTCDKNSTNIQIEKGSIATSYSPYFEPIELCKISTYKDRIYKSNDKWYLEKNVGKVVLNGSENWIRYKDNTTNTVAFRVDDTIYNTNVNNNILKCNYYTNYKWLDSILPSLDEPYLSQAVIGDIVINTYRSLLSGINNNDFKDYVKNLYDNGTPIVVYYPLQTPTTTEITDSTLVSQLNAIQDYLVAYKINKEFILGYDSPTVEWEES